MNSLALATGQCEEGCRDIGRQNDTRGLPRPSLAEGLTPYARHARERQVGPQNRAVGR
jgi:hypothetical protein